MKRGSRGISGRISVARLRRWLAAGVVTLLVALAGFIGYAHYRMRHLHIRIPQQFGVDIKSEGNGFTISRSAGGHKLFTIHAAREVQHRNDNFTLNDVSIVLYGPADSDRMDSISGAQFEYDKPQSLVRAAGTVHIDLAAPGKVSGGASPTPARRVAMTTSGVVFDQKSSVATTDEPIDFTYGNMHGQARGMRYDANSGTLQLLQDVHVDATQNGEPVTLVAASADIDRNSQKALLRSGLLSNAGNTLRGNTMLLNLRKEGGLDKVFADGDVQIAGKQGAVVHAQHMVAQMSSQSRPEHARLTGGVHMVDGNRTGSASEGTISFGSNGEARTVDLLGSVRLDEQGLLPDEHQELRGQHIIARLAVESGRPGRPPGSQEPARLRDVVAEGGATLVSTHRIQATAAQHPGAHTNTSILQTTTVAAPVLRALGAEHNGRSYIAQIAGEGGSSLRQTDSTGLLRTSTANHLVVHLLPPAAPGAQQPSAAQGQIASSEEAGHVVITEHQPAAAARPGSPGHPAQDTRAVADRADYDGHSQAVTLTGSPVLTGNGFQISADRITAIQNTAEHAPGGLVAQGNVQASMEQSGDKASAVHVVATRAEMRGTDTQATFSSDIGQVRLWTATGLLQAHTVDMARTTGTLHASGPGPVELTLASGPASQSKAHDSTIRIETADLTYRDGTAGHGSTAKFLGGVRVDQGDTVLTAETAEAVLSPGKVTAHNEAATAPESPAPAAAGMLEGNIQSMVASGNVHLAQPGRTGVGAKLVYTAADQTYVLTGTQSAPPVLSDSLHGSTTAASLIFHGGNDSVDVAGVPGRRVRTETRAKPEARTH